MAPVYVDLPAWNAASLPSLALLSAVILFVLAVTLLVLCTSCQRQSFTLDRNTEMKYKQEKSSSTLVQVVKPGSEAERKFSVLPEDLQHGPNQPYQSWRSHTLSHDRELNIQHIGVNHDLETI